MSPAPPPSALPYLAERLLRALLPLAERDEVVADLRAEYRERTERDGAGAARLWAWRQAAASTPALLRRCWWRGMTGFEPRANHMRPGGPPMESWIIDTRYALRRLRSRPLYAFLAVLTLALGVGGAAAITGIVRELLMKPLPYAAERELGVFWSRDDWSESEILYMRLDWPGFRNVAGYRELGVTLRQGTAPARLLAGLSSSAELLDVLGTPPLLGRGFQAGEDRLGADPVAVLSWRLWQELGGDASIVGRRLRLDGAERTVVGVMPRGFWFPDPAVRVWLAEALDPENRAGNYTMLGRVAPGGSAQDVMPQLARITARLAQRYTYPAQWDKTNNARVTPLRDALLGPVRTPLFATLAAMAMILLIACANVAALMLGQVDGRVTELAVRSALGADRRRLLQQLVAESVVIGVGAGLAGALLAAAGFQVLVTALPLGAWGEGAHLEWTVFASAMVMAVAASLLVALVPVISLTRGDLRGVLATMRTSGVGARGGRMESALVVAEVSLAVLMVAGAALLVRSVGKLYAIDPGVNVKGAAVLDMVLPGDMEIEDRRSTLRRLTDELQALPGVKAVAVTAKLPLRGGGNSCGLSIQGKPEVQGASTFFRVVSPGYLETMGIPLRAGRTFTRADAALGPAREGGEGLTVVNQALADKYFAGEDPIGRMIGGCGIDHERIVGVVGNVSEAGLADPKAPARYILYDQMPFVQDTETAVLRVGAGLRPESVLEPARRTVERGAASVAVQQATTLELVVQQAVGPARQVMILLGLLGALAVLLGAVGVYGVVSHFVARRQREWAIRIALGLSPSRVVEQVARRGAALVGIGIAIGVVSAVVLARLIGSLLYGVTAGDPLALAGASLALLLVGVGAALIPAWRASRTRPALLLREL